VVIKDSNSNINNEPMKTIYSLILIILALVGLGCEEEVNQYDFEKYKFVSFIASNITVPETYPTDNNGEAYPIYLRYDGSVLETDFTVTLKITPNNAQPGVDYDVENTTVTFKAGEIKSEPLNIHIVDNLLNSDQERSLDISIESVSNPNIDIGVGIVNQSNKSATLYITDDECSETISIFNSSNLISSAGNHTVSGSVAGNMLTLTGNLIDYGAFPNAELGIALIPTVEGGTAGAATFDNYAAGTDNDGYVYEFRQNGEGTYNICAGEIEVSIDVYYESGGTWVFWYTSHNVFSIP
tara:strand:- start:2136 stop:3026 length:891 start_codon:yes stop_codon:yes gene_type:complete